MVARCLGVPHFIYSPTERRFCGFQVLVVVNVHMHFFFLQIYVFSFFVDNSVITASHHKSVFTFVKVSKTSSKVAASFCISVSDEGECPMIFILASAQCYH